MTILCWSYGRFFSLVVMSPSLSDQDEMSVNDK